jgi:hypothetical protein
MSTKELLLKEMEHAPERLLHELLDFARFLKHKSLNERRETALASENVLAKDWLRPEEDDAWRNL